MSLPFLFVPTFRGFDTAGNPLAGGLLYTYAANTLTPQTTWSDAAGVTPNTNPIVLDTTGSATVRLSGAAYKFVLKDSGGSTQWTQDFYQSSYLTASDIGGLLYPQTPAEIAASVTPVNFSYPPGNVLRYGAKGDDSTINDTAFAAAFAVAQASGITPFTITFPQGTYRTLVPQNWYLFGIVLQAEGTVIYKSTASSGNIMVFDAGAAVNGYYARLLGNWILDSTNAGVGAGLLVRNVNHGEFHCSVRNVVSAGCNVQGAVLTLFDIAVTATHGGAFTTTPVNGIVIDGSAAETQTTACWFNLTIESCSGVGVVLTKCAASIFYGTSEGAPVTGGVSIGSATFNFDNVFDAFFIEGTQMLGAIDCAGSGNAFRNCNAASIPYAVTFTGTVALAATSATLSGAWANPSGAYTVALFETSGGAPEIRTITLTNGATTATWSGGLSAQCAAAATTISVLFRDTGERNRFEGGNFGDLIIGSGSPGNVVWGGTSTTGQVRDFGLGSIVFARQPGLSGSIPPVKMVTREGWTNATYAGAWSNSSGTYVRAQYTKNDATGEIILRGEAGGGVAGTTIFVLPAGYRPLKAVSFIAAGNSANNFASITIDTSGNVTHTSPGYTTSLDLSFSFFAD